jgi:hypothetical protein
VSGRRGWVARLAAVRSSSPTRPPQAPPVLSSGPARSSGPERGPLSDPGPRSGAAASAPEGPALRVVLVSRDTMLAAALRTLIEVPGGVRMLDWHADDLERAIRRIDVVVVDMPPQLHARTFAVLDGRFLGRTIVLLQEGETEETLPPGPFRIVLYRPLQIGELWTAVTGSSATALAPDPLPQAPPASAPLPEAEVDVHPRDAAAELEPDAPDRTEEPGAEADPEPYAEVDPEPEAEADPDAETGQPVEGQGAGNAVKGRGHGLRVARSGLLIGFSGRELEPVIGPGQVAPGMDAATLERLRRWGTRRRQPAGGEPGPAEPAARRSWSAPWAGRGSGAARPDLRGWAARAGRTVAGRRPRVRVGGLVRPVVVVAMTAAVGLAAAGWRGPGGPDTLASEVAVVEAVVSTESGLALQDPRIGPIQPLHAVAVGAWLRATGAEVSLEAAALAARTPSRFLLAVAVALSMLLSLLLMRVGPGTGAAAGPGPAPPHAGARPAGRGRWRLGVAALVGVLVALDPVLVRGGRVATGTILAVVLGLGALALAWTLPQRPAWRWLPVVGASSGLALLASPLTLPVLAVPAVAALLQGRRRAAGQALAGLGLGAALWLVLPVWVAGLDLGPGQAGWLLGRPPGRGTLGTSLAAFTSSWLLLTAGLVAAAVAWRRGRPMPDGGVGTARLLAWTATTGVGSLVALAVGYPVDQALAFALPAAAAAVALALPWTGPVPHAASRAGRLALAVVGVTVAGLVVAQGLDWGRRYAGRPDDALGRLVAAVDAQVADCSAVNASGPDDRARLLAAGTTVTQFSSGPAARAAGVRYFVVTDSARSGGPKAPALAAWVRRHGTRLAGHPSSSLSRVELWRVDAEPLDPAADHLPVPGGVFSNVVGSACGGYRVVDSQQGAFHAAYSALGGKGVLGRPLGSVWTSDGPALQAFDTVVLGAAPSLTGQLPQVRPIDLTLLLDKVNREALAKADMPVRSAPAPTTDVQARALLKDQTIARAYLGVAPASASTADWRRARERFGRPVGMPQVMPDGATRQPFERVILELPAEGGAVRPAALGRLAVRLGLVPVEARRLEPVPGLPAQLEAIPVGSGPLLWLLAGGLVLLALGAGGLKALAARRSGRGAASATGGPLAGR